MRPKIAPAIVALVVVVGVGVGVSTASAQEKVTLSHRTTSTTKPYLTVVVTTTDALAHADHTGPIFSAVGPDGKWGDIIPPFDDFAGLNFTAEGHAILENGGTIPAPPSPTVAAPAGEAAPSGAAPSPPPPGAAVAAPVVGAAPRLTG